MELKETDRSTRAIIHKEITVQSRPYYTVSHKSGP